MDFGYLTKIIVVIPSAFTPTPTRALPGKCSSEMDNKIIKDATASSKPGLTWGAEVPFGTGQVDAPAFLAALRNIDYRGPLVIEREAGPSRVADVEHAIRVLSDNLGKQG